jgi:hypothetical protein
MGLNYAFTLRANGSVPTAELQAFLESVEEDAVELGFDPTMVFTATFSTPEERRFARRIHTLYPVSAEKLEGVVLPSPDQVLDFDPNAGRCRVLPELAVALVVTNEHQNETAFAFARYPENLNDANGRPMLELPVGGRWHFSDFIQSPDPRYRTLVKRFADAGYLEAVQDDFYPAKPMTKAEFDEIIAANQEVQKRNPFGSEPHRKAYEAIRKAVSEYHGKDIGEYTD